MTNKKIKQQRERIRIFSAKILKRVYNTLSNLEILFM